MVRLLMYLIYGVGVVVTAFLGVCACKTAVDFGKKKIKQQQEEKRATKPDDANASATPTEVTA